MAHQVFVSYATEDADTASRVCALLEADGIQCWVAPRDVKAGTDYAAAIMDAIRNSQLVVLIFSTHSNASPYALREIERSVAYGRPVLALRTDDADPNSSMEYYLHQWIEAPEGVESKRKEIIATVREQLARPSTGAASAGRGPVPAPRPPVRLQPGTRTAAAQARAWVLRPWGIAVVAVLVVAAVGVGLGLGLTRDQAASQAGMMGNHISWNKLLDSSRTLPSARSAHSMVYDPGTQRMILFGGRGDAAGYSDTWAYDPAANTWTELEPSGTQPSARSAHSMVYDPVSHQMIMFGGFGDIGSLNDTWAYDPAADTWTLLKPSGTLPSRRGAHSMVYDPVSHQMIMFGGSGDTGTSLDDTWAYDPATNIWTELEPAGTLPSARSAHSLTHDPASGRLIMFGGASYKSYQDTWAYDPATDIWTELEPSGTQLLARSAQSMAYDPARGRFIMFGGDSAGTLLDDTAVYDPAANAWTELEPSGMRPTARSAHSMVYDPAGGRFIMFGGDSAGAFLDDTWVFDPAANTWTELEPSGMRPTARSAHSMVYDPTSGRLILFGGAIALALLDDTWAYDPVANAWTELKPSGTLPPARSAHSMAYDPGTHRLIMFGGRGDAGTSLNDTWAYDPTANAWTELKPSGTLPPARSAHSMAYDPGTHRLIMFGGRGDAGTSLNDAWAYDPATNAWIELKPAGTLPSPRNLFSMAYDPLTHGLIVFGGQGDTGLLNDTWAYDTTANAWTELKPAGTLPWTRSAQSMAYDPTSGRLIVFAGLDSAGTVLGDAWAYESAANTWTELEPSGTQPAARAGHVMVYDPASGRLIMFGGRSIDQFDFLNDVWTCAPG